MSIISLAHLIDQTEIAYRLYVYNIYIYIYLNRQYIFFRWHIKSAQGLNLPNRALYQYFRLDDPPRSSPSD